MARLSFFKKMDESKICLFCVFLCKHNDSLLAVLLILVCSSAHTQVCGGADIASFAALGNPACATRFPAQRQRMQLQLTPPRIPLTWMLHPSVQ